MQLLHKPRTWSKTVFRDVLAGAPVGSETGAAFTFLLFWDASATQYSSQKKMFSRESLASEQSAENLQFEHNPSVYLCIRFSLA